MGSIPKAPLSAALRRRERTGPVMRIPTGWKFLPKGHILVRDFLLNKVLDRPTPADMIDELALYSFGPDELPLDCTTDEKAVTYFYVPASGPLAGSGTCRRVPGGYWKVIGPKTAVEEAAEVIGFKTKFAFFSGTAPKGKRTKWRMTEYRLAPELQPATDPAGPKTDGWVACKVYSTDREVIKRVERQLRSGEIVSKVEYVSWHTTPKISVENADGDKSIKVIGS